MLIQKIEMYMRFAFYALFFITPLVMFPTTSELFELNKMWVVWGITLVIIGLWLSKMCITRTRVFRRTPLDIPLALFLISQLLSTIFSMNSHVSFWGYYTRFNGGFLSLLAYIVLYYAFASNLLDSKRLSSYKSIFVTFIAGTVVALWGLPSHFGYDPTCLVFRGSLDVSCWTEAFQPKLRIFSTLGQPNWLAAFLSIMLPLALAYGITQISGYVRDKTTKSFLLKAFAAFATALIIYIDITWTDSQSGFLGVWGALIIFASLVFLKFALNRARPILRIQVLTLGVMIGLFILMSIILGTPIARLQQLSLTQFSKQDTASVSATQTVQSLPALEFGGTNSSTIRLIVWRGAIDVFKANPILGSGVETFAYAYYQHRPSEHNLTSEWDYLYNKAHNEYLNYLATTGIIGLGSYLLFIVWFLVLAVKSIRKYLIKKNEVPAETFPNSTSFTFASALLGGWISILISNFFGFSVVLTNLFLFMLPVWFLHLMYPKFSDTPDEFPKSYVLSGIGKFTIGVIIFTICVLELILLRYWIADKTYALGSNLNKVGEYVTANEQLVNAVRLRPGEDLYKDELSINFATLAFLYAEQGQATEAARLAQQSKFLSDQIVEDNPSNVSFWKSRTRVMYSLAQIEPSVFPLAIDAIDRAHTLAPTDAKVMYNQALMYSQAGDMDKALNILDEAKKLKPNYRDAYFVQAQLAITYADTISTQSAEQATLLRTQAKENLDIILNNLVPNDSEAKELRESLQ